MKFGLGQPTPAPQRGLFNATEKRRVVVMGVTLALAAVALFFAIAKFGLSAGKAGVEAPPQDDGAPLQVQVVTPPIRADEYRRLAKDATREERAVLETPALRTALEDVRLLTDAHFEPMNGVELDAPRCEELRAKSEASRGRIFRVRGWIEEVARLDATDATPQHYRGRVRLEDGALVDFALHGFGDELPVREDFVRFDGAFLKLLGTSTPSGWVELPLLVGARGLRSYPALGTVSALEMHEFVDVVDDSAESGLSPMPFDEYWTLIAYARDVAPGEIDWAAAPLLDGKLMAEIVAGDSPARAIPLRLPPARIQGIWRQAQSENPARLAYLTEGWLGSWEWTKVSNGVLRFVSPQEIARLPGEDGAPGRLLDEEDEVVARGFFLKNFAYEPRTGGIAIAPLFVLHSVEPFAAPKTKLWTYILVGVAISFAVFVAVLLATLRRDSRKTSELQAELVRRRRERRAQAQSS